MRKKGSEIIAGLLERQGITTVTGIPGGSSLPLYDALRDGPIRHVLARHEQGAGFIAQGMARATGRAAVCLATSGPGATNLLTAVADARLDSVPLVAVTGQVPSSMIGTDAFQEVDTYGLSLPITKHNFFVRRAADLLEVIPEAFSLAESGRPGPVLVDVPKDVQSETVEFDRWPEPGRPVAPHAPPSRQVAAVARAIEGAARPVLLAGGGVVASGASALLTETAVKNAVPVASTLAGLGTFPPDHPLWLGMLGMHGARFTNVLMEEADLLVAVGARFDDRATGRAEEFCRHASIVHVDIDPSELGKIKPTNLSVAADAGETLRMLLPLLRRRERSEWNSRAAELRGAFTTAPPPRDPLHPVAFVRGLAELAGPEATVTTDVGQHQMWVAQHYPVRRPRGLLTSGGLGTMGFGLPAAIGAALVSPAGRVLCVSGDGSILMNIQELSTLAELGLEVKVLVMNNGHLGLVRQQQELFYGGREFASRFHHRPDFAAVASGFGVPGFDLARERDPLAALERVLSAPGPALVNVPVPHGENVFPMVPPGAANREMIGGEVARA